MLLHDAQELNDDFGAGSDEDLSFPGLLGVVDGIERIVQDAGFDHLGGLYANEILNSTVGGEVSILCRKFYVLAIGALSAKSALAVKGS